MGLECTSVAKLSNQLLYYLLPNLKILQNIHLFIVEFIETLVSK